MPAQVQPLQQQVKVGYGHTQTHVIMTFSVSVQDVQFPPEQVDEVVKNLLEAKKMLLEYQAKQAN